MENITLEIGYGWKHGVDTILFLAKVLDERGVGCPFHFHLILLPYLLFLGDTHIVCACIALSARQYLANKKSKFYIYFILSQSFMMSLKWAQSDERSVWLMTCDCEPLFMTISRIFCTLPVARLSSSITNTQEGASGARIHSWAIPRLGSQVFKSRLAGVLGRAYRDALGTRYPDQAAGSRGVCHQHDVGQHARMSVSA